MNYGGVPVSSSGGVHGIVVRDPEPNRKVPNSTGEFGPVNDPLKLFALFEVAAAANKTKDERNDLEGMMTSTFEGRYDEKGLMRKA